MHAFWSFQTYLWYCLAHHPYLEFNPRWKSHAMNTILPDTFWQWYLFKIDGPISPFPCQRLPRLKQKSLSNHKKQTIESTTKSTQVYFSGKTLELTVQTTQENDIIYYINEHFGLHEYTLHLKTAYKKPFFLKILLGKDFHSNPSKPVWCYVPSGQDSNSLAFRKL